MSFAALWQGAMNRSRLCVGIDPAPATLAKWGLEDTPEGLASFSTTMLQACHLRVGCVKPQSAYFERHGAAGIAVLESVHRIARDLGMTVISDVKRGDIGSTMTGYADAYFNPALPLATDAITVSPYLGTDVLDAVCAAAEKWEKGFFVLALTSNPSGAQVQHAQDLGGVSVAARVVEYVAEFNDRVGASLGGLVVGATIGAAARECGINLSEFNGPILAPGFGAQGATVTDLKNVFGQAFYNNRVFVNVARGVAGAGPEVSNISATIGELSAHIDTING